MLKPGDKAPEFDLESDAGERVSLKSLAGRPAVVYFYPRDNTPGCTLEAQGFRDAAAKLTKKGAVVLGVSRDSIASHCKFRDQHGLNFRLLSDPDAKAIKAYGAWGEKNMYGKKTEGILRTTVIIDEDGNVAKVFPKVKVAGHVDEVVAAL